MKRDEVAVGLLRAFNDPDVEQFTLYEDELVLVVHADHPCGDVARLAELGRRAVRAVRPRVELPRADAGDVPRRGDRAARRDGARQRRLGEEDGRARSRHRVPPPRRRRGRGAKRPPAHRRARRPAPTAPPDRRRAPQGRGRSARRDGGVPRRCCARCGPSFRLRRQRPRRAATPLARPSAPRRLDPSNASPTALRAAQWEGVVCRRDSRRAQRACKLAQLMRLLFELLELGQVVAQIRSLGVSESRPI